MEKRFEDLSKEELYEILKVRAEVFVCEQNIVYNDMDGVDLEAYHCYIRKDGKIISYARVYLEEGKVHLGRVLTLKEYRRKGYAQELINSCLALAKREFGADKMYLAAQVYVKSLYQGLGFEQISDLYYIDGLEHVDMVKEL